MSHVARRAGSGALVCACGWESGHFSHDDDLWEAFDVHAADDDEYMTPDETRAWLAERGL